MNRLAVLATIGSIVLALLAGAVLLALSGFSPGASYVTLLEGATGLDFAGRGDFFRLPARLGSTLNECAALLLAALAVAAPWRLGWVNLGAEGQMLLGATAACAVTLGLSAQAGPAVLLLALVAAAVAGGLWSLLAAWARQHRGMNEIITTIMLNFVAFWFVAWLCNGPMRDTGSGMGHPWSPPVPAASQLPRLGGEIRFHAGLLLGPLLAVSLWIVQRWRVSGFEERVAGSAGPTARFAGFRVERLEARAMAFGGACAGLGGACALLGVQWRLSAEVAMGYGFTGLTIALAARAHPLAIIPCALFFATLRTGAEQMEFSAGVPQALAVILQALVLFFLLLALAPQWGRWQSARRTRRAALAAATPDGKEGARA